MIASQIAALTLLMAGPPAEDDFGLWGSMLVTGDFEPRAPRLNAWIELQLRGQDNGSELNTILARTALGVRVAKSLTLWAGFAYVPVFADGRRVDEYRPWEQILYTRKLDNGIGFQSRTRLDNRLVETGDDVGWRFRQLVGISIPIAGKFSFVSWDELFINLNSTDWGAQRGLDQNRAFGGLGRQMTPELQAQVGYVNQASPRRGLTGLNHILLVFALYRF